MSFKQNDMINLGNYEEYFIQYMDNELAAEQKLMVEAFLAQHPHLVEELDLLMSTKLPLDEVSFTGKEELLSSSMKMAMVDENLLLYIDNELPAAERKAVEQKIASNQDYALQHSVLMQTKLSTAEKISHPNKKELYRHTERVIAFKLWMRIAAAVIILFVGSLFFLLNKSDQPVAPIATNNQLPKNASDLKKEASPTEKAIQKTIPAKDEISLVQTSEDRPQQKQARSVNARKEQGKEIAMPVSPDENNLAHQQKQREVIRFDVNRFTAQPKINEDAVVVNKTIAYNSVTSSTPDRTTNEDAQEPADPSGDFKNTKKTPAKGFFRKVTRFIERNTGIGTANADDEVLIGAVALKLK
jgi:hypothetical protein